MFGKLVFTAFLLMGTSSHASMLNEMSDRSIGWRHLAEISQSLNKFDEHLATIFHSSQKSRFSLLELLATQAKETSFDNGELSLMTQFKCKKPILSWETEDSLTTVRSISVYFRGCQYNAQTLLYKIVWPSKRDAVVSVSSSGLARLMDLGSAAELGFNTSCSLRAGVDRIDSIDCENMSFKASTVEDIVLREAKFEEAGARKLHANGFKYKYLQRSAEVNLVLENIPGALAIVKQRIYKNKELKQLDNFQVVKPVEKMEKIALDGYELNVSPQVRKKPLQQVEPKVKAEMAIGHLAGSPVETPSRDNSDVDQEFDGDSEDADLYEEEFDGEQEESEISALDEDDIDESEES